ncbi:hypothetical protein GCM10010412_036010 [Nonomuraea recticatena]|uniref:Uncharacterized protein n=1 Tax=Nonomuraea recticatena TaxID=46178 RepID=A0ABN3RW61_9ACTN
MLLAEPLPVAELEGVSEPVVSATAGDAVTRAPAARRPQRTAVVVMRDRGLSFHVADRVS